MDLRRGKLKNTGEWIIGSVICIEEKAFVLTTPYLEPERPAYNGIAMGCGLEDRGLTENSYLAMEYGWEEALERYEDNFPIWEELVPETVTRCCQKCDVLGNVLFEGDVYANPDGVLFEICYGRYSAYCAECNSWMENVGFFVVSDEAAKLYMVNKAMPLGKTEDYAYLVGNIFDKQTEEIVELHNKYIKKMEEYKHE